MHKSKLQIVDFGIRIESRSKIGIENLKST